MVAPKLTMDSVPVLRPCRVGGQFLPRCVVAAGLSSAFVQSCARPEPEPAEQASEVRDTGIQWRCRRAASEHSEHLHAAALEQAVALVLALGLAALGSMQNKRGGSQPKLLSPIHEY